MRRRLSSMLTLYYKFVLLPLVIVFLTIQLIALATSAFSEIVVAFYPILLLFLVLAGVVLAYTHRWTSRLKRVDVNGYALYVSNYRKEIQIPLTAIEAITENYWPSPKTVTITLEEPTEFGDKIVFLLPIPLFIDLGLIKSHPIVAELKTLASLERD